MDFYYQKINLTNELSYTGSFYLEDAKKDLWMFDCLVECDCCNSDIKEIANLLFNYLVSAKNSGRVYNKRRVANLYDNGYHYENIPENKNVVKRFKAVTFLNESEDI